MKRRGVITLVMATELIFIAILLVLFASLASYGTDAEKTEELVIAEDITLLLDTMQSVPFDFQYEYETDLLGKNISLEGNDVAVVDSLSADEIAKTLFYGRSFSKIANMNFPAEQTLQGSLLTITKQGDSFTLTDKGGSKATPLITTAKRTKDELRVRVDYTKTQNQGQNTILQGLKTKTEAALLAEGFTVDPTTQANMNILFAFASEQDNYGEQHSITYSTAQQTETQYLAEEFKTSLESRLQIPILTNPRSYSGDPTIAFNVLNTQAGIAELNNDDIQNIIALTVAGYFDQTYKEATN